MKKKSASLGILFSHKFLTNRKMKLSSPTRLTSGALHISGRFGCCWQYFSLSAHFPAPSPLSFSIHPALPSDCGNVCKALHSHPPWPGVTDLHPPGDSSEPWGQGQHLRGLDGSPQPGLCPCVPSRQPPPPASFPDGG